MTGPDTLVIFDYSGTLSLEAPLFGRPENLVRALAESGLAALGVATPEAFWTKIVHPTWIEGSTTGIGYKRLLAEGIAALGLVPGVSYPEIAAAASRFVDGYLEHSRIDPRWKGLLSRLGGDPSVLTMIATDHYAEATATITGNLGSLASRISIANSADMGSWKGDRRFWERITQRLPVAEVRRVLIVDDFGANEAQGDEYGGEAKVQARQAETLANLRAVFRGDVEAIPFFLKGSPSDREAAAARLIAETISRIDAFLGEALMEDKGCKPKIDYPCLWGYKVIGRDRDLLSSAIAEVLAGIVHTVTPAHSSKGGAYHCLNVETTVDSEAQRLALYERLRCHPAIVMVL